MNPVISIIHPSRSRPNKAKLARAIWLNKISNYARYEYIISLDESDPELSHYEELFYPGEVFVSNSENIVQAINNAVKFCVGEIIVVMSDDFNCPENWDLKIIEALEGKSGVLKTWDGIQKRIVTLPIMTRDYYEERGYIFHPDFKHSWADTFLTEQAQRANKLTVRLDIHFPHNHYSVTGEQPDELYKRNDLTHDRDRHIFQAKMKTL